MMTQIPIDFPEERRAQVAAHRQISLTVEMPGDVLSAGLLVNAIDQLAAQWGGAVVASSTNFRFSQGKVDVTPRGEILWLNQAWSSGLPTNAVCKWSSPFTSKAWGELKHACRHSKACAITCVIRQEDGFMRMKMAMTEAGYKERSSNGHASV